MIVDLTRIIIDPSLATIYAQVYRMVAELAQCAKESQPLLADDVARPIEE